MRYRPRIGTAAPLGTHRCARRARGRYSSPHWWYSAPCWSQHYNNNSRSSSAAAVLHPTGTILRSLSPSLKARSKPPSALEHQRFPAIATGCRAPSGFRLAGPARKARTGLCCPPRKSHIRIGALPLCPSGLTDAPGSVKHYVNFVSLSNPLNNVEHLVAGAHGVIVDLPAGLFSSLYRHRPG